MSMNEDEQRAPSVRDLRRGARVRMAMANKRLEGKPGMSRDEQLHGISHAKTALIEALALLEMASHQIMVRDAAEQAEIKIAQGLHAIEDMLAETATTNNTTEEN